MRPLAPLLRTHLSGLLVYAAGDTAAAVLLHQVSGPRLAGLALVGGLLYSWEVPAYFRWIDRRLPAEGHGRARRWSRAAVSLLYFNPLWIARHLFFLRLFTGQTPLLSASLLGIATQSFLVNALPTLGVNYIIQNNVRAEWRFLVSALFSGVMAVYYALSAGWFG